MSARWKQQKRQTRLTFQSLPTSSPAKETYSPAIQERLASVRFEGVVPQRSTRSFPSEGEKGLPTPEPSSQPQIQVSKHGSSNDGGLLTPSKSRATGGTRNQINDEGEEEEDDEIVVPSSKRRKANNEIPIQTPTRRSTRLNGSDTPSSDALSGPRTRSSSTQIASSPPVRRAWSIGSPETSGDDNDAIITRPPNKRRASRKAVYDDPFIAPDADEEPTRLRTGSRAKRQQNDFVVDDDDIQCISSGEEAPQPLKPRRENKARRRARSRKEQDELEDDLQDLQDSDHQDDHISNSDEGHGTARRTRGGPVTTARDLAREQIELLRRRRQGEKIPQEGSVDFEEVDGVNLDDIAAGHHSISDDAASSESDTDAPAEEQFVAVEDDDDFIVEDEEEDAQYSRRPQTGIPLAFTSFASSKPRELFVHIVEWLVKNRIAPAFSRDDELYTLSWNKVNDQIKAQAGSRLISSAWNADFKNAVLARPLCNFTYIAEGHDEFFLDCDACNRTNHPARYEFQFSGHAYHPDTLEPLDDDDVDEDEDEHEGDEEDEDNDKASYDQAGHLLPTSSRTFNLGRFCAANAEMGHKLTHWKYHLNQSLLDYLDEQGVLSAEAILTREKLSKKKREKEAENIVDIMQQTGVIQKLWKDLQSDLEDARFGMEDHVAKNGGRRNKKRIGKVRVTRPDGRTEEHSEGGRVRLIVPSDSEGE